MVKVASIFKMVPTFKDGSNKDKLKDKTISLFTLMAPIIEDLLKIHKKMVMGNFVP